MYLLRLLLLHLGEGGDRMLVAIIIGAVLGSFSHVVGLRLPLKQNWWNSRSRCDSCQRVLSWNELVPLVSYIWLQGKCKNCTQRIPVGHVIAELFGAVYSVCAFLLIGWSLDYVAALLFCVFITIICTADWYYMLVPNRVLIYVGIPLTIVMLQQERLLECLLGAVLGFAVLYSIMIVTNGIGAGDVKLMLILGSIVSIQQLFMMLFLACVIGFIIVFLLRSRQIPFAPALCIATMLCYFAQLLQIQSLL